MSSQIQTRPRRTTVKRTLSVDDIISESNNSESNSLENLNADKNKNGWVVVNTKRRRKQKPSQLPNNVAQGSESRPEPQSNGTPASINAEIGTDIEVDTDTATSVLNQNNTTTGNVSDVYIDEIKKLKGVVKILQTKLTFVLSFLGIDRDETTQTDLRTETTPSTTQSDAVAVADIDANNSQLRSYSDTVQKPSLSAPFKNAVVSGVQGVYA